MRPEEYIRPTFLRLDITLGYLYFLDCGHPLASKVGRVYYHRHVASLKVGRWLTSEESVHHADGNKTNNDPDNLEVLTRSEHVSIHNAERGLMSRPEHDVVCVGCSELFVTTDPGRRYCARSCVTKLQRKFEIGKEELSRRVWTEPIRDIARDLGVSDVAVHKRCRRLGVEKPPQGYWLHSRPCIGPDF